MTQTDQQNVPTLRFPGFGQNWKQDALSEYIGSLSAGVSVNSGDRPANDSELGILKTSSVNGGIFNRDENKVVDQPEEVARLKEPVQRDTIVISRMNTPALVGENAYVEMSDPSLFLPDRLWAAKGKTHSSMRFLSYILGGGRTRRRISDLGTGTSGSMKNIAKKDVLALEVIVPSLPEQRKIAAFLSAVDTKISQLAHKKALLEDYKKGCMQQLFSQVIRFKDEDGNDFPDWKGKRLGDIAVRVKSKNTSQVITEVLTNSAVQGIISQGDYFDHAIANVENLDRYTVVKIGDFVYNPRISVTAPVGPIKRNTLKLGIMSPLYDVFRFNFKENCSFWEQYFSTAAWHRYMKQVANYGARHDRMAISSSDFFDMPLPYPDLAEQLKIADFLSSLDRKIDLAGRELIHVRTFKKGLLQQMFV